jgi:hypothetical protein
MPLTISDERYRAIRAAVVARRDVELAAEIEAVDWDKLPHFSDVYDSLTFLDTVDEADAGQPGPHKSGVER